MFICTCFTSSISKTISSLIVSFLPPCPCLISSYSLLYQSRQSASVIRPMICFSGVNSSKALKRFLSLNISPISLMKSFFCSSSIIDGIFSTGYSASSLSASSTYGLWSVPLSSLQPVLQYSANDFMNTSPPASLSPNTLRLLSVASSRLRKHTMLPQSFTVFSMRFVRLQACSRPCIFRFLSTQSVLSVFASKPVRNIPTTIRMSISLFFILKDTSL